MRIGKGSGVSGSVASQGMAGGSRKIGSLEKGYMGYIMISPFVVVFIVFSLYSVLNTIWLAFTDTQLLVPSSGKFVGMYNFQRLLKDRVFIKSIGNTWKIWLLNFIPQLGIAMLLSVWFTSSFLKLKLVGMWRSLLYLPNMFMPATVGVLYFKLFQDIYSPANQFLTMINAIPEPIRFMDKPVFLQMLTAYIQWWMWYGNTIIILVAGMSSIPASFYESGMIDGANGWKMFRYITLPALRPILVYTLVTSLVGGMQMFDIPYFIAQQGGPGNAISTMYTVMFRKYDAGKKFIGAAASVGIVILLITTVCSLIIFRVLRDRDAASEAKAKKLAAKERKLRQRMVM